MRQASQSLLLEEQATAGPQFPRLSKEQGVLATSIYARLAGGSLDAETCTRIISAQSFPSLGLTLSTDSLIACTAALKEYRSYAEAATQLRQRGKMHNDGNSLKQRLKSLLEKDKRSQAEKAIEAAANEMLGEDNFVHRLEAQALSTIDLDRLQSFLDKVKRIRNDLETEYFFATQQLSEANNEQDSGTTEQ